MRTSKRIPALAVAAALILAGCGTTVQGHARVVPGVGPASPASTSTSTSESGTSASSSTASAPATGLGPIEGAIGRPVAGGKGAGQIVAGLEEFYNQQLSWQSCTPFTTDPAQAKPFADAALDCANLIVPLNYADPAGPTVTMAVMRAKATGPDRVGAIQVNPGGPGESGLTQVAGMISDGVSDTLHKSFDFIGFDTRGLGASRPLVHCDTDAEQDALRAANLRTNTPEAIAANKASVQEWVQRCADRTGADAGIDGKAFLAAIGTDSTVKDMDVLRSVLGEDQMTYLGYSYGTRLGYVYADQFTANVRAMLLDGAVDPKSDPDQEQIGQAKGFEGTFTAFAKSCAALPACVLGDDPSKADAVYQALTRPLLGAPVGLKDGRVLTYADAITATVVALYSESTWSILRTGLTNLSHGDGTLVMALADFYDGRDASGHYSGTLNLLTAVRCVDDPRKDPNSTDTTVNQQYNAAAPFQDSGDPVVAIPDTCSLWPVPTTLSREPLDVQGLAKVVVVSTTGDPATPYQSGVNLAQQLGGSLITVQGDRHTAYLSAGIACVDDAVTAYLVDLTLPPSGLTCS